MSRNNIKYLEGSFKESVFVYASGQSSSLFPLEEYKDKKYIVVNGAVKKFIDLSVSPFVYLFDDGGFLNSNVELVLDAIKLSRFIFLPENLYVEYDLKSKVSCEDQEKIFFIDKINKSNGVVLGSYKFFFFKNIFNKKLEFDFLRIFYSSKNIGFSKDITQGYFCARTIPYVAMQLAYYLGFKKVFFIGLDLNASVGRFYDNENPLPTTLDKDYPRHIYPSFSFAAKRIVNKEFLVYNLSGSSRMPGNIIPKITLNDLSRLFSEN